MKPYYQDDAVTLYLGDCREILPDLPKPDLILTDPPYNNSYHYDQYSDRIPVDDYFALLESACVPPCVLIHYPDFFFKFSFQIGQFPDELVAWVYHANTPRQWRMIAWFGATPDFAKDGQNYQNPTDRRIRAVIEKGKRARLYDWWEVEQVKNIGSEKTKHPCQIPLKIMLRIINITPAELILDPFLGSGTTAVAAKKLGRKCIGIEISEAYLDIAANRCRQMVMDLE